MKKIIRTLVILLCIFTAFVIVFSLRMNRRETIVTVEADDPTLPVAYMQIGTTTANEMFAYRHMLREETERESLTPLPVDRNLVFLLDRYENSITSIQYELKNIADGTVLENGQLTEYTEDNGRISAPFTIQTSIRSGQEYTLLFTVGLGSGQQVYFYTRLVQNGYMDLAPYFAYVQTFADTCLNKLSSGELGAYLETDASFPNRSLQDVTIYSSTDMASWLNMAPTLVRRGIPIVREVNASTVSMELNYIISATDSSGNAEFYTVKDYFRMRAGSKDIALLNFNRCASEIFDGSAVDAQTEDGLLLGVASRDMEFRGSPSAKIAAFVMNGDLWSYEQETGRCARIFSFRQVTSQTYTGTLDIRTENTSHDIAIERVEDNGDVTFAVYGYMASGTHEGETGVSVCTYYAGQNAVVERIFVPLNQSFDILKENISRLSYVNAEEKLYLFLGSELCEVSLENGSYSIIREGISADGFVVSDSQRTAAFVNGANNGEADEATIIDLDTGRTSTVRAPGGQRIISCGFLNEDLVYGLVREEDLVTDLFGDTHYGIWQICIQGMDGEVEKQYGEEGTYVVAVRQETTGLELTLASRTTDGFQVTGTDHIMNNEQKDTGVKIAPSVYDRNGEQLSLVFPESLMSIPTQKTVYSSLAYITGAETVIEWPQADTLEYRVYGYGGLNGQYEDSGEAVQAANAIAGVVLNRAQQYIWERGNWLPVYTVDMSGLPAGVLDAPMDQAELQNILGDKYTVLDMAGCTQESMYYYLSKGYPVLGKYSIRSGEYLTIVGYDSYNIWVYDGEGGTYAIANEDSAKNFERYGNVFLTYCAK